jgi:hypothetical protein
MLFLVSVPVHAEGNEVVKLKSIDSFYVVDVVVFVHVPGELLAFL